MHILIFALVVVIVVVLSFVLIDLAVSGITADARLVIALKVLVIAIAIVAVCSRAGFV